MYEVKKRVLKINSDLIYPIGDTVPYSAFECIPERIRNRRIQTLLSFGRLEEIPDSNSSEIVAESAAPIPKKRGMPKKQGRTKKRGRPKKEGD